MSARDFLLAFRRLSTRSPQPSEGMVVGIPDPRPFGKAQHQVDFFCQPSSMVRWVLEARGADDERLIR